MENGPVRRCAHCDCDKGGESCKWIMPSTAAKSVSIKDLTWEAIGEGYWIAESIVGTYRVGSGGNEAAGFWFAWTLDDEDIYSQGTPAGSIEAAKAAAQAGYLDLITSALSDEPAQQASHKDLRSTFSQLLNAALQVQPSEGAEKPTVMSVITALVAQQEPFDQALLPQLDAPVQAFTQETLAAVAKDALRAAANVYLVWENGGHDYDVENEIMKLSIDDILKPHLGDA